MPRKSLAEIETHSLAPIPTIGATARISPSSALSEAEHAIWVQLVNDQPADAFAPTHIPMLEMYCRHVALSRVLAKQISEFPMHELSDSDGLKMYDKLLKMAEREGRAASSLATRLRITRQATDHPATVGARSAANRQKKARPWETGAMND